PIEVTYCAAASPGLSRARGHGGRTWLARVRARIAGTWRVRPRARIAQRRLVRRPVLACLFACALGASAAAAGDLRVLCPSALRAPVLESARSFARAGGHRVEFVFAGVASIHKRVATG